MKNRPMIFIGVLLIVFGMIGSSQPNQKWIPMSEKIFAGIAIIHVVLIFISAMRFIGLHIFVAMNGKSFERWTLQQVLIAMVQGDGFYTKGVNSGKIARVEKYMCSRCQRIHIRSTPDAVSDNNLDNLRRCNFRKD